MAGVAVLGAGGMSALWLLSPDKSDTERQLEEVTRQNEALLRRERELQRAIERLTDEERIAEVHVIDQVRAGELLNGQAAPSDITTIEFIEIDREQHPLPSRRFQICDDVIFFDALVLKFDDAYVQMGDALRGKSLALFRRIYGEHQKPAEGFPVDPSGDVPNIYRVNPEPNEFEKELWSKFWEYAQQPKLAESLGVRVVQGEAVYVPMRRGQVWTLTLETNGGLNIRLRRPASQPGATATTDHAAEG
jgi:hypothetical protein